MPKGCEFPVGRCILIISGNRVHVNPLRRNRRNPLLGAALPPEGGREGGEQEKTRRHHTRRTFARGRGLTWGALARPLAPGREEARDPEARGGPIRPPATTDAPAEALRRGGGGSSGPGRLLPPGPTERRGGRGKGGPWAARLDPCRSRSAEPEQPPGGQGGWGGRASPRRRARAPDGPEGPEWRIKGAVARGGA